MLLKILFNARSASLMFLLLLIINVHAQTPPIDPDELPGLGGSSNSSSSEVPV